MRQAFNYRLYPNKTQQPIMDAMLEPCRWLYNRLLAERQEAYEKSGKTLSYVAQANSFRGMRRFRCSNPSIRRCCRMSPSG